MNHDLQPMFMLAMRLSREAGAIALPRRGQAPLGVKADRSLVTQTDHDVQAHILRGIASAFPDHAVLAEESSAEKQRFPRPQDARFCWVVDPIDGTRNFITGFPCFATSIAVLDRGTPVVAAVYEHNLGALYVATAGHGATLNDQPISVREPPEGEDWLMGGPSTKDPLTTRILQKIVVTRGLIYRNVGSSAVHLAWAASGALAGAFANRCKIWDIAAGALLVTEAGGRITGLSGEELSPFHLTLDPETDIPFIAGPPAIHARLVSLLGMSPRVR